MNNIQNALCIQEFYDQPADSCPKVSCHNEHQRVPEWLWQAVRQFPHCRYCVGAIGIDIPEKNS